MILTWQSFFENDPFNSEGEILENEEDNSLNNASGRINNTITGLNASSVSGPSIEFVEFSTEDVRFFCKCRQYKYKCQMFKYFRDFCKMKENRRTFKTMRQTFWTNT